MPAVENENNSFLTSNYFELFRCILGAVFICRKHCGLNLDSQKILERADIREDIKLQPVGRQTSSEIGEIKKNYTFSQNLIKTTTQFNFSCLQGRKDGVRLVPVSLDHDGFTREKDGDARLG